MKYPITLDALEVLDAIDRKGSFAAAANELFRVPSAISYTVQKLEQDLSVVLFRKEGRKAVRGVAIFAKAFMGIPAQQAAKTTRPLMPAAAPAVLLHSLDTQQGVSNIILAMTRRDVGKPAFSLRKKTLRENTCAIASGDYSTPVSQRLTQAGKVLLEQGREILEATERLAIATKKTHSGWEPVFNIAIDTILNFDFIYPLVDRFYEVLPDIEINIYEEVLGGAQEAITSNRADLVIGAGAEPTPNQGIKYQKIRQVEWVFTVAPGHELTQTSLPLSRKMIEQHRFIVVRDSSRNQAPQSHRVFSKRPVLSVPSMAEKINALRSSLGVGFLPAHRIQDLLEQGLLIALPVEDTIPIDTLHMAWKTTNKGKVLRWFIEQLSQHDFT